jgi:hypothetical protein
MTRLILSEHEMRLKQSPDMIFFELGAPNPTQNERGPCKRSLDMIGCSSPKLISESIPRGRSCATPTVRREPFIDESDSWLGLELRSGGGGAGGGEWRINVSGGDGARCRS